MLAAPGRRRAFCAAAEGHGTYVVAVLAYPRAFTSEDRVEYLELDVLATPARVADPQVGTRGGPRTGQRDRCPHRCGRRGGEAFHAAVDDAADAFLELLDGLYEEIDDLGVRVEQLSEWTSDDGSRSAYELLLARRFASATRGVARRIVDGRIDVGKADLFPGEVEALFVDTYETLVRVTEELDVRATCSPGSATTTRRRSPSSRTTSRRSHDDRALVLVPSLIVGFDGQNFADGSATRTSVGVSLGLIVVTTLVQLAIFRWRRWF